MADDARDFELRRLWKLLEKHCSPAALADQSVQAIIRRIKTKSTRKQIAALVVAISLLSVCMQNPHGAELGSGLANEILDAVGRVHPDSVSGAADDDEPKPGPIH